MADSGPGGRPTVRYEPHGAAWFFGDRRRWLNGSAEMVVHVGDLAQCSATDLQRVMRRAVRDTGYGDTVLVSKVEEASFDEDGGLVSPVSFELDDGALKLSISFLLDDYDEDLQPRMIAQALAPLLRRHRMTLLLTWPDEQYAASPWLWHARFGFNTRGRTLAALFKVGQDALAVLQAMDGGQLTRATVADLVRAGHARVLIGQPEGHWLDVKSQYYDLATPHGEIALAQAVTRFCNAELGGLVVVGMTTKKVPGGEEIRGLCPVPRDNKALARYRQVLERRVFPPPDHLAIEAVSVDGGMLVLIDVPPQPEELKPFLVYGAIVGGEIEGAFISIVRRRGESSIPITAPMIHSTLAAGRALLRRGELSREPHVETRGVPAGGKEPAGSGG